jgi:hypothetical protein
MLFCPSAVAENQPTNKHRMNQELPSFAARLRELISSFVAAEVTRLKFAEPDAGICASIRSEPPHVGCYDHEFNLLALELFSLQFKYNAAYRKICEARNLTPESVTHWTQIPSMPTSAFKELELTSIPPAERTAVFHSSGTTEQKPSRHFHCPESLVVYEMSLWKSFEFQFGDAGDLMFLTPPRESVPNSSLVHMFETVRQKFHLPKSAFAGNISADGSWSVDFEGAIQKLKSAVGSGMPLTLLGTAFSFVHLLDYLAEHDLQFELSKDSRVMETGGYKNRSRTMSKAELHALITKRLGVTPENILCEYGMSELSSQAYDSSNHLLSSILQLRTFRFPPWARAQIISPETGREVGEGETGLIRVFDLANVFSVAAVQTGDLAIRRGDGFELVGRAPSAEPRGCSLMTGWTSYNPTS